MLPAATGPDLCQSTSQILNLVERLEDTNDLSYADHRFQQALQKDGKTVISLLTHVVSSPEETSIVLHLRGEDAEVFMDALQDVRLPLP